MVEFDFFGDDARFHYIGVAVKSIKKILPQYKVVFDNVQKVSVVFVSLSGITLELIEPYGDSSPVALALQKNQKLLHLCFEVPSLKKAVALSRKYGFYPISKAVRASAFKKKKILWVYSLEYGLFELLGDE